MMCHVVADGAAECRRNQFLPEEPITRTSAFISWAIRTMSGPVVRRPEGVAVPRRARAPPPSDRGRMSLGV